MIVHQILVGRMQNFTYVIYDEDTSAAIVLDPSWDLDKVQNILEQHKLKTKYIVNTHNHFDHTLGNQALAKSLGVSILQHPASGLPHDTDINDGDSIKFGKSSLAVLHTPGHSQDSICLVGDGKVFTGDTLFVGSCGRVDLPGGSAEDLYDSLFGIVAKLDGSLVVYPGHNYGPTATSTISREVDSNPVLQYRTKQDFLSLM